jgi:hypothetical protein
MTNQEPERAPWPPVGTGRWTRWWGYFARWAAFGIVVNIFQPVVENAEPLWLEKTYQGLWGLWFGFVCAVVFTLAENKLNVQSVRWKTWGLVFVTWLLVKVVFVSTLAALGPAAT